MKIQVVIVRQIVQDGRTIVQTHGTLAYHLLRAKFYELAPMISSKRKKGYAWYFKDMIRTSHVGNYLRVQLNHILVPRVHNFA